MKTVFILKSGKNNYGVNLTQVDANDLFEIPLPNYSLGLENNVLKLYREGAIQSEVTLESSSIIIEYELYVDVLNGDNQTAILGDIQKPFQTIEAAIDRLTIEKPRTIDALEHPYFALYFLSDGLYKWGGLIPERNCVIDTKYKHVTIDFSENQNSVLSQNNGLGMNLILRGEFLTIKNHSGNYIVNVNMNIYGYCQTIDSRRSGFGGFTTPFIIAKEIKLKYELVKGYGNVFRTYYNRSQNEFIGNISAEGDLCLNVQANGFSIIDFDFATSVGRLLLMKISLPNVNALIHFGTCVPFTAGNIYEGGTGTVVNFKLNAVCGGSFIGNDLTFTGNLVKLERTLGRISTKVTLEKLHIQGGSNLGSIFTLFGNNATVHVKNCLIEFIKGGLIAIETNLNFVNPILELFGFNAILHTNPTSPLITKYNNTAPLNVRYTQHTQSGLKTNMLLNTTITGNTNTPATLTILQTQTY